MQRQNYKMQNVNFYNSLKMPSIIIHSNLLMNAIKRIKYITVHSTVHDENDVATNGSRFVNLRWLLDSMSIMDVATKQSMHIRVWSHVNFEGFHENRNIVWNKTLSNVGLAGLLRTTMPRSETVSSCELMLIVSYDGFVFHFYAAEGVLHFLMDIDCRMFTCP